MIYFSEAMPRSFLIKALRTVESPPPAPPPNYSPPPSQRPSSPSSTSESPPRCCGDRHTSAFSLVSPREARIKEAAATVRGNGIWSGLWTWKCSSTWRLINISVLPSLLLIIDLDLPWYISVISSSLTHWRLQLMSVIYNDPLRTWHKTQCVSFTNNR